MEKAKPTKKDDISTFFRRLDFDGFQSSFRGGKAKSIDLFWPNSTFLSRLDLDGLRALSGLEKAKGRKTRTSESRKIARGSAATHLFEKPDNRETSLGVELLKTG